MKKFAFYIWLLLPVIVLVFTIGCSCGSDVPLRYPTMTELPELESGMSSSIIIDDIIEVPANELWHKTIEIPDTLENVKVVGWFAASGGARNDIKTLFLNDVDFHNWRNFSKVKGIYQSEKISVDNFTAEIKTPGKYHLVFSNWFSEFSTKKVIAKVYLYWSVKPVTYKIMADNTVLNADGTVLNADDFQIPASANVTFDFTGGGDSLDFKVSQAKDNEEIYVSANITGPKLWFIAPAYIEDNNNNYDFSCSCTPAVEGGFKVIAAAPSIGRGLMVSSSMANGPPRIEEKNISYNPDDPTTSNFTIEAIDPDDDVLIYYAFNIPRIASDINSANRTWVPVATISQTSGEFSWNGTAVKDLPRANEYWIRFEVFDGILSDQWVLKIPKK